jgi:hypothetical protein
MAAATISLVSAKAGVARPSRRTSLKVSAAAYNGQYAEELVKTAVSFINRARGGDRSRRWAGVDSKVSLPIVARLMGRRIPY